MYVWFAFGINKIEWHFIYHIHKEQQATVCIFPLLRLHDCAERERQKFLNDIHKMMERRCIYA